MNHDLHRQRAAEIFGVPYEQVTDAQRKYAKIVYFARDYNVSVSIQQKLDQMKEAARARDDHN